MRIHISAQGIDITPSLKTYIDKKFGSLSKFIEAFDKTGQAKILVEISRTTGHHRKGMVYRAAVDMDLPPKNMLRAEEFSEDLRAAIDSVKNKLTREIRKYKTKHFALRRAGSKAMFS